MFVNTVVMLAQVVLQIADKVIMSVYNVNLILLVLITIGEINVMNPNVYHVL